MIVMPSTISARTSSGSASCGKVTSISDPGTSRSDFVAARPSTVTAPARELGRLAPRDAEHPGQAHVDALAVESLGHLQ